MGRLIDADAIISFVDAGHLRNPLELAWSDNDVVDMIESRPTVDAVPVRCKDCKYCYAEGFVNVRNVCEKHYDFGNVDDDWFCADGERRSDGKEEG
jgi:hypothetical protein